MSTNSIHLSNLSISKLKILRVFLESTFKGSSFITLLLPSKFGIFFIFLVTDLIHLWVNGLSGFIVFIIFIIILCLRVTGHRICLIGQYLLLSLFNFMFNFFDKIVILFLLFLSLCLYLWLVLLLICRQKPQLYILWWVNRLVYQDFIVYFPIILDLLE